MKIQTAIKTAAIFFGIGTFIFIGHLLLPETMAFYVLGLVFILIAFVVNSIAVIYSTVKLIKYDQLETFYAICILLSNIPIAATYMHIALN